MKKRMDTEELLTRAHGLWLDASGDVAGKLKNSVELALTAIEKRQFGEALNQLRQAQELLDKNRDLLAEWEAELAVTWALYYLRNGPETSAMWKKIRLAQRLEPDNESLNQIINLIKSARGQ